MKVQIEVTKEQAKIISSCLDYALRTAMGQLESDYLPNQIQSLLFKNSKDTNNFLEKRDVWDNTVGFLKTLLHPDLVKNEYKSYNLNDFTRNCASLSKIINVKLKEHQDKDEENPQWNVDSSFIDIYKVPIAKITIK